MAVNQGIRASNGITICLLNNDVIVTPGWAERLLAGLDKYSIVGPMTSYAAGVQLVNMPVYYDRAELDKRAEEFAWARSGRTLDVNWVTGFCYLFRRSLYDELGPFDESLWPCTGEEIDFCLRARQRGRKVGIIQDVYVHHEGSLTFKSLAEDYNTIIERNNKHLAQKWGPGTWSNQLIPFTAGEGLRLNVGCGRFKLPGFINIDKSPREGPDVQADALHLPYDPGTVDEIYAGHILEHFSYHDGEKALHHWRDLLRDGGSLSVSVPDYDYLVRRYVEDPTPSNLREMNDLYIYSQFQESPHCYAYSGELLRERMQAAGFTDLKRMPVEHPYFPLPVEWQVGYTGIKRELNHARL